MLEAATLKNCDVLYQRTGGYEFNKEKLEAFKKELVGQYSQPLVNLILKMVDINPNNRPLASKVYESLHPY